MKSKTPVTQSIGIGTAITMNRIDELANFQENYEFQASDFILRNYQVKLSYFLNMAK